MKLTAVIKVVEIITLIPDLLKNSSNLLYYCNNL